MQTISATYRVTTPMFLGGSSDAETEEHRALRFSPDHPAELRLPSFKGALRFWWRALAWDRCRDAGQLRKEEAELFGSSDEAVGQSKVLMKLHPYCADVLRADIKEKHQLKDGGKVVGEGVRYLGYGVMEAFKRRIKDSNRNVIRETEPAQLTRSCLLAPFSFTVELLFKPGVSEEQRNQVRRALQLLGLLGGLGSKSRKGYGSLTLTSLVIKQRRDDEGNEDWKPPESPQEFVERLSELLGSSQIRAGNADATVFDNLPEWTAFSPASRILVLPPDGRDRTPLALLDRVGREMVRYRSWGNKNQRTGKHEIFRGVQSEQNFTEDHDAIYKSLSLRRAPANAPKRAVFGLPHNYFFGSLRAKADVKPDSYDRRASPLLIHVHQTTERSTPIAVVTFLPSCFLPEDKSMISVGGSNVALATSELWKPIEDWFKRLKDEMPKPHDRKEPFGAVVEVKHD